MKKDLTSIVILCALSVLTSCAYNSTVNTQNWLLVDNFEGHGEPQPSLQNWFVEDVQNDTQPLVPNPQVALVEYNAQNNNHFYLKKPAAEGIVGNRKALSYKALPQAVLVGETYTFYTRFNVESFPNNHSFGLSNMLPKEINEHSYNAFEPMLRVTDKAESNGYKNTGALTVIASHNEKGKVVYQDVQNTLLKQDAKPLSTDTWYQVWYVVNNATKAQGGQRYTVYMQGGEFAKQQKVFDSALFRMGREQALSYFITIANTGPKKQPYGNGGLRFDDIYMHKGLVLSVPE